VEQVSLSPPQFGEVENGVSVPGLMGERVPWARLHQLLSLARGK